MRAFLKLYFSLAIGPFGSIMLLCLVTSVGCVDEVSPRATSRLESSQGTPPVTLALLLDFIFESSLL